MTTTDSELVDQLLRRVDVLEGDKRRWKRIAITAIALLLLLFLGSTLVVGGLGSVWYRSVLARMEAEQAQIRAAQAALDGLQAELARTQAEQARRAAEDRAKKQE